MSRKVTLEAVELFLDPEQIQNRSKTFGKNTRVFWNTSYMKVLELHDNPIAQITEEILSITTAGWNTNTTKERLNGLPGGAGVPRKEEALSQW